MFGKFKEFHPPSVNNSYFQGLSFAGLQHTGVVQEGTVGKSESNRDPEEQMSMIERMAPSPFNSEATRRNAETFAKLGSQNRIGMESMSSSNQNNENVGRMRPNFPMNEYSKAIADLTNALTEAVNEKSVLMTENSVLKERVSSYEQKLSEVDKMFTAMMARISALERSVPGSAEATAMGSAGSIKKSFTPQSTPRSSAKSTPRVAASFGAASRSASSDRSVLGSVQRSGSSQSNGRSGSAHKRDISAPRNAQRVENVLDRSSDRSAVGVSRGRMSAGPPSARSVSANKPAPVRPVGNGSPIRYEVHVSLNNQLVAKAQLASNLTPDGPFLYIAQCELKPHVRVAASSMEGFRGLSLTVMANNTRTRQENVIFKSHASHIENPPINAQDGYFSHSCWLSGPDASIVGSVRIFYRPEQDALTGSMICLYGMSLKYWFPADDPTVSAPAFGEMHWKQLLKLLGIL